jgi:hypothetical protein
VRATHRTFERGAKDRITSRARESAKAVGVLRAIRTRRGGCPFNERTGRVRAGTERSGSCVRARARPNGRASTRLTFKKEVFRRASFQPRFKIDGLTTVCFASTRC